MEDPRIASRYLGISHQDDGASGWCELDCSGVNGSSKDFREHIWDLFIEMHAHPILQFGQGKGFLSENFLLNTGQKCPFRSPKSLYGFGFKPICFDLGKGIYRNEGFWVA